MLHGARSYLLQDEDGQTIESHSISAGLDYPGVGPEHAWLHDIGRASYQPVTDAQAMEAFGLLCRTEGIIPAIESAHALAGAIELGRELGPESRDPGQPVRPRRQGRRHRGDAGSACFRRRGPPRERRRRDPGRTRSEGRAALVGYLPVGLPDLDTSIAAMVAMVEGGVDIVEVGVPYSDPVMDGPVIQHAGRGRAGRRAPGPGRASQRCKASSTPAHRRW